jgi:hypothetical protein
MNSLFLELNIPMKNEMMVVVDWWWTVVAVYIRMWRHEPTRFWSFTRLRSGTYDFKYMLTSLLTSKRSRIGAPKTPIAGSSV